MYQRPGEGTGDYDGHIDGKDLDGSDGFVFVAKVLAFGSQWRDMYY